MHAVVITHAGGPEVLAWREVPAPLPADGEVLVRVHATAVNRADILQRLGRYPAPPGAPPDIPGLELAGEVIAHGPNASRWPIGARVFGIVGGGAHAELVATHQDILAAIPDGMSWTDAAAIPEVFITAHDALVTQAGITAGESVLIHAVASGVGLATVQIARAWAAVPFGTTRSAAKVAPATALGLADALVLGRDLDPLGPAVERWTAGRGIDTTLDLVGGPYFIASIKVAASRGRIMLVGSLAGPPTDFPLGMVMHKRLVIRGTVLRSRSRAEKIEATSRFAREVVPLFANGQLRPTVDSILPLRQVAEAHRRMESDQSVGKIVLTVG